jgi:DNA-directed RNA polymerase subunit K
MTQSHENFTKYEIARIIGARALQIAMDAPILIKMTEADLKEIKYDALKIAEREFNENALPITIHRPTPQKRKDKLTAVREEKVSDAEIAAKEQEVEKEVVADAEQLGFAQTDEETVEIEAGSEEQ